MNITLRTFDLIEEFNALYKKLDKELEKEFRPVIKKLVAENDLDGLQELRKCIPENHTFFIKVCQGIVEVQNKLKKNGI